MTTAEPQVADAVPVEYLYGTVCYWPDDGPEVREVVPFRVTRKTAKRVYYVRRGLRFGPEYIAFIDREALERDGEVRRKSGHWWEDDHHLFATRDAAEAHIGIGAGADRPFAPEVPDLAQLKQEMADAHPDRGGTAEEFIAARKRYESAAAKVAAQQREAS